MTNYTACKCALAIVFLLVLAAGPAQSAPTPEQLEFVKVLRGRAGGRKVVLTCDLPPAAAPCSRRFTPARNR